MMKYINTQNLSIEKVKTVLIIETEKNRNKQTKEKPTVHNQYNYHHQFKYIDPKFFNELKDYIYIVLNQSITNCRFFNI